MSIDENYVRCTEEDQEGWYRCLACNAKIYYTPDHQIDYLRHEERCRNR